MLTIWLVAIVLLPYFAYVLAAKRLQWQDRRLKKSIQHVNELTTALVLATAIYFVGGYDEAFHWIMPILTTATT